MTGMKRKIEFSSRAVYHIYHRSRDKGVIFYNLNDRIVYYTLAATSARKYNIVVSASSLMFTHLHQSIEASTRESMIQYLRSTDSSFVRLYNSHYGLTGKLFDRDPGHSPKFTLKEKKSNLIYVFNNHVEKGLCKYAREERWSFFAYAFSNNPFSKEIDLKNASKALIKVLRLVDRRVRKNKALDYGDLDRILPILNSDEKEQFVDYVISRYAWVDFSRAASRFESLEAMELAINSTTGAEYEIREDYYKEKDTGYVDLNSFSRKYGFAGRILTLTPEEKMNYILRARYETQASDAQLRRYFHCDFHAGR